MANETLSQAYLRYKDYLEAQGWAENTIKNKLQVLHHAKATWHNPVVRRIRPADINRYFAGHDWNERTRNLYLGGLRAFFKFCRETSITPPDHDPTIGWRMLREPDSQMFWIPPSEFNALMDATEHPRDRMIVAIGLFALCRGSEVRTLTFGDVDLDAGKLHVYQIKNKRELSLPIVANLRAEFERYFEWVTSIQGPIQSWWNLTPPRAKRFTSGLTFQQAAFQPPAVMEMDKQYAHIYKPVREAFVALGYDLPGKTGNHALRRSGARNLLEHFRRIEGEQSAILRVSTMLGHKSEKDTRKYLGMHLEMEQLHDRLIGTDVLGDPNADVRLRVV